MLGKKLIKSNDSGGGVCTSDITDIFEDSSGIALYQLNWDGSDMSGNYNGVSTDVSFVNGHIDSAANFTGTNYILTPTFGGISTFSYSFWVNLNGGGGTNKYIFGYQTLGAATGGGQLYLGAGNTLLYYANGNIQTWSGSPTLSYDTWHHVVVSASSGTATIYVDNVSKGTGSYTGMTLVQNYIGTASSDIGGSNNATHGSIDQVRIFNKAISASEVSTLYAEAACAKTCTTDTPQIVPDCIAYYKLDGNATDSNGSGTLYDGTATNVSWTQGRFGSAGGFNGTSSYINNGYIPSLVTQEFSISTWVKFSALTDNQTIASNYVSSGGTSRGWFIRYTSSNGLQFAFRNSTTDISLSNNYVPNISEWINVCVVISATSKTLYIDGVVNATLGSDSIIYLGNQETYFGRLGILGIQYLNGDIDQVRIFNKAISAEEVTTLYNEVAC